MPPEPLYLDQVRLGNAQSLKEAPKPRWEEKPQTRYFEVSQLTMSLLASDCTKRLNEAGIYPQQSTDFDEAMRAVEFMDKPYLTDFLSPRKNDFFEGNAYWLLLMDADGQPAGATGCRMDDTGREPLASYANRKLRNLFPEEDHVSIRHDRLPRVAEEIHGRVIYTGDLFMGAGLRSTSRENLRTIALLQYCLMYLKWSDFDWLYAFLRDKDVRRGAAWLYHFPRTYPMAHSWTSPPSDQSGNNWLAAMTRIEMIDLFASYFAAPDRL